MAESPKHDAALPGLFKRFELIYVEVAHQLGLIDTDLGLAHARVRLQINTHARRYVSDSLFSLGIREPGPPLGS